MAPDEAASHLFHGRITVRIKDFTGQVPEGQERQSETKYFDAGHAHGCTWSIQIQGRFLKEVSADDLVWGNQFEKPIRDRLPWGTSTALKAISYLDPSLKQDIYADRPWAFSPLIATMTRINYKRVPDAASASSAEEAFKKPDWPAFPSGAAGDGSYVHDDTSPLLLKAGTNEVDPKVEHAADLSIVRELRGGDDGNAHAHTKRVSFWKEEHRELVSVGGGDLVTTACFDQGYLDFNTLRLELPYTGGMGFDLKKYWDGQPVRFYCKNNKTDEVAFVVEFQIESLDA
ncbi:DUF1769-domain-containing protein [Tilletiopsis washingtonensis]|uniref:DUF1769-domain-containing protein n=1 Tax=Tilletiopsis washingtonensis TaxID=58919 RepID=A0A316ZCF7_9BASI|nr:DUF1769-domain-containing protein [Tilletiopsis washingtonensis]PWN98612.1 DUF1769-domain-containing protein [Tilletiopsis washingtonensis]